MIKGGKRVIVRLLITAGLQDPKSTYDQYDMMGAPH
jgi:hypothetical protein